jgi:hypothetical protein
MKTPSSRQADINPSRSCLFRAPKEPAMAFLATSAPIIKSSFQTECLWMRTFHAGCRRLEIEQEVQHIYCDPCWSSEAACMHITIPILNSIETAGHRKTPLENESLLAHNALIQTPRAPLNSTKSSCVRQLAAATTLEAEQRSLCTWHRRASPEP